MTVKTLIEKLQELPQGLDVFIDERSTEFQFGELNGARVASINFYESVGDETPLAEDVDVVVLSEE